MNTTTDKLAEALEFFLDAWDGGETSWFGKCYEAETKAREALDAHKAAALHREGELDQAEKLAALRPVCRYISDVLASDASQSEKHIARTIMLLLPLQASSVVPAEPKHRAATYTKLWTRHGQGDTEWWSLGKLQARKEGDDWVVRRKGAEVSRHEFLQVAMAEADTEPDAPDTNNPERANRDSEERQPLSEEQIATINAAYGFADGFIGYARAIERLHNIGPKE